MNIKFCLHFFFPTTLINYIIIDWGKLVLSKYIEYATNKIKFTHPYSNRCRVNSVNNKLIIYKYIYYY